MKQTIIRVMSVAMLSAFGILQSQAQIVEMSADGKAVMQECVVMTKSVTSDDIANKIEGMNAVAVDLGLPSGTLWSDRDLGAKSNGEIGLRFCYGNTLPYDKNNEETHGVKRSTDLDETSDAAQVRWGNGWRTPSLEEAEELIKYTRCYYITGKVDKTGMAYYHRGVLLVGPNGNSIMLPTIEYYHYTVHMLNTKGEYCSNQSPYWCIRGDDSGVETSQFSYSYAVPVRPVKGGKESK